MLTSVNQNSSRRKSPVMSKKWYESSKDKRKIQVIIHPPDFNPSRNIR